LHGSVASPTIPLMGPEKNERNWRIWVAGVLAALVLIVALQNSQSVDVNVLMVNLTAPLIVVILAAAAIGAIVGYVAPLVRRHHRQERENP
ncbi:MAG TPA: lipopolysaccharide assembly protein LapA domain-containing protein, partial [Solirubrobacterales bacterium]